jgi:hypothetical protein
VTGIGLLHGDHGDAVGPAFRRQPERQKAGSDSSRCIE